MATRMTWDSFIAIPNGTRIKNHGYDQCVALANLYHESVIGGSFVPVPSAYQWWTQFGSYATLRDNYTQSGTPVAGAIFVSKGGPYNNVDGHIGVVTSVNGNGTFNTMEQNATYRDVWRYTRNMAGVYGFLIPKNNPAGGSSAKPTPETTEEEDLMAIYLRPTGNSSPIKPGDTGSSRIWAGDDRKISDVTYSGTWERSEDGSVRRLFPDEWAAIQRAYAVTGRKIPLTTIAANDLEKMVYVKR